MIQILSSGKQKLGKKTSSFIECVSKIFCFQDNSLIRFLNNDLIGLCGSVDPAECFLVSPVLIIKENLIKTERISGIHQRKFLLQEIGELEINFSRLWNRNL